jgi:hypothetical protein
LEEVRRGKVNEGDQSLTVEGYNTVSQEMLRTSRESYFFRSQPLTNTAKYPGNKCTW